VLDVEVEVTDNRCAYRGKEKKDSERFRLVAVYNEDEDKYHLYITNLSTDLLQAEEVARLYGARWEVEILFKELKSKYAFMRHRLRTSMYRTCLLSFLMPSFALMAHAHWQLISGVFGIFC
jgi:IS4 transposase